MYNYTNVLKKKKQEVNFDNDIRTTWTVIITDANVVCAGRERWNEA